MAKTWCCPFWSWEEGLSIHCEGVRLRFRGRDERLAYIERFCASVPGWEECPVAVTLCEKSEKELDDDRKR